MFGDSQFTTLVQISQQLLNMMSKSASVVYVVFSAAQQMSPLSSISRKMKIPQTESTQPLGLHAFFWSHLKDK